MEPITRRSLFAGVCAVVALGASEVPASANAAVKRLPGGKLSVKLKDVPALAAVGGATRIGSIKGVPVGIARVGTNKYTAFNLRCPHQGITVTRNEKGWMCPAHNSEFEPDGDLVLGPATTALAPVAIKVSRGVATIG
ncbi:MAG: Rieske (2Fe-2S) protein [Candidatus Planktophila sp.]|nr:Rieske (2Fe-2S) protein [Candidatus Planktophila sp.]